MIIQYSKQFLKDIADLSERQAKQMEKRLSLFQKQPTHPQLNNHKLKGNLKGYCSINISGDLRAVYRIEEDKINGVTINFVRLNTHSKLYG